MQTLGFDAKPNTFRQVDNHSVKHCETRVNLAHVTGSALSMQAASQAVMKAARAAPQRCQALWMHYAYSVHLLTSLISVVRPLSPCMQSSWRMPSGS